MNTKLSRSLFINASTLYRHQKRWGDRLAQHLSWLVLGLQNQWGGRAAEDNTIQGLMGSHTHHNANLSPSLCRSYENPNNCAYEYDAVPERPNGWQLMCMLWRMEPIPERGPNATVMHPIGR